MKLFAPSRASSAQKELRKVVAASKRFCRVATRYLYMIQSGNENGEEHLSFSLSECESAFIDQVAQWLSVPLGLEKAQVRFLAGSIFRHSHARFVVVVSFLSNPYSPSPHSAMSSGPTLVTCSIFEQLIGTAFRFQRERTSRPSFNFVARRP